VVALGKSRLGNKANERSAPRRWDSPTRKLDLKNRILYWTDRGDPPRGNTVNRAAIDVKRKPGDTPDILVTHLMEAIGIALDVPGNRMFVTDLAGSVYSSKLDGSQERNLLYAQGNLTGIAYAEIQTG